MAGWWRREERAPATSVPGVLGTRKLDNWTKSDKLKCYLKMGLPMISGVQGERNLESLYKSSPSRGLKKLCQ